MSYSLEEFLKTVPPSSNLLEKKAQDITGLFNGRYKIVRLLGKGLTSIVFLARDDKLNRDVALKVWNSINPNHHSKFINEGRLLANIDNPHIVSIYDYGEIIDMEIPWVALEYIKEHPLRHYIDNKISLEVDEILSIGIQLLDIIIYLNNSVGVVQLDLSPNDIAYSIESKKIKLIDLGSAINVNQSEFNALRYGTPGYIAPELFSYYPITSNADVYSVGVILLELLSGKNPILKTQKEILGVAFDWISVSEEFNPNKHLERLINSSKLISPGYFLKDINLGDELKNMLEKFLNINKSNVHKSQDFPYEILSYKNDRPNAHEAKTILESLLGKKKKAPPLLFISHSSLDKERFVFKFAKDLINEGLNIWLDEWNLRIGEVFWEKIADAINDADFIILILSKNSLSSIGVREELRTAQLMNLNKTKILPLIIDPVDILNIPLHLQSRQVFNLVEWGDKEIYANGINKLVEDILYHYDNI